MRGVKIFLFRFDEITLTTIYFVDRIQFDSLLQWQVDKVIQEGALTAIQAEIFRLLLEGKLYDKGIASKLGMSRRSYYRHKRKLKSKVFSVLFRGT